MKKTEPSVSGKIPEAIEKAQIQEHLKLIRQTEPESLHFLQVQLLEYLVDPRKKDEKIPNTTHIIMGCNNTQ
jgi:hypothetical protein